MKLTKDDIKLDGVRGFLGYYTDEVIISIYGNNKEEAKQTKQQILQDQKLRELIVNIQKRVNEVGWDDADISPDVFDKLLEDSQND